MRGAVMEKLEKVVVTYGHGEGKTVTVRVKPIAVENSAVPVMGLGDCYVSRSILNALDLKDSDKVKLTFEKA